MSAFNKKKNLGEDVKPENRVEESPQDIIRRRRELKAQHEASQEQGGGEVEQPKGMEAEKPVGALCFLPKSLHRIATRYADDHDLTAKRFFFQTMLIGLEQQGIITPEQHQEALTIPNDYGWKGRGSNSVIVQ